MIKKKKVKKFKVDETVIAILIQRSVRKSDVLPKRSTDVLSFRTCLRVAKILASKFK